jgi:hypothetical protein
MLSLLVLCSATVFAASRLPVSASIPHVVEARNSPSAVSTNSKSKTKRTNVAIAVELDGKYVQSLVYTLSVYRSYRLLLSGWPLVSSDGEERTQGKLFTEEPHNKSGVAQVAQRSRRNVFSVLSYSFRHSPLPTALLAEVRLGKTNTDRTQSTHRRGSACSTKGTKVLC